MHRLVADAGALRAPQGRAGRSARGPLADTVRRAAPYLGQPDSASALDGALFSLLHSSMTGESATVPR